MWNLLRWKNGSEKFRTKNIKNRNSVKRIPRFCMSSAGGFGIQEAV